MTVAVAPKKTWRLLAEDSIGLIMFLAAVFLFIHHVFDAGREMAGFWAMVGGLLYWSGV